MKELTKSELKCIEGGSSDAADKFLAVCATAGLIMTGIALIATGPVGVPVGIAVGIMGGSMSIGATVAGIVKAFAT